MSNWRKVADNLYRRTDSPFFYVVWHANRRKRFRTTRTTSLKEAKRLRDEWLSRLRSSAMTRDERTMYEQLREVLIDFWTVRDRKPALEKFISTRAKHLDPFFQGATAIEIAEGGMIGRYIALRKREGSAAASINRETQALVQMFRIAAADEHRLVSRGLVPKIRKLEEAPPRTGTISDKQFADVMAKVVDWAKPPLMALNICGWRVEAVLSRRRTDVVDQFLILDRESSKNRTAYRWPLAGEMGDLVAAQLAQIERDEKRLRRVIPWLFHKDGRRIDYQALRAAWRTAAKEAGYPGKLMHDFRRTVATRIDDRHISRAVGKILMGMKTTSIWDRYVQTPDARLTDAAKELSVKGREVKVDTIVAGK